MSDVFEAKRKQVTQNGSSVVIAIAAVVIAFIILSSSFVTIGPGQRGVVFSRIDGVKELVLDEGLHFKIPYLDTIIPMNVRIQKVQTDSATSSKDTQRVSSTIAINFRIDPEKVNIVYQSIGMDYKITVIDPALQEAVKAATALFRAEELIERREEVSSIIKANLANRLKPHNIQVIEFSIMDFTFSEEFNASIESKKKAEQQAMQAEHDLKRIEIESEQLLTKARAEAKAQEIQKRTISANILQLRAIEKWDGHFPQVVGGALPFIDIDSLQKKNR